MKFTEKLKMADITFTQNEPGAVERDLLDKVRDIQNANDYATLQEAVDAKRSSTIQYKFE